jgi:alpha/beta superfamily hydrolase
MKLIIAGSRDFSDYNLLKRSVDELIQGLALNADDPVEIINGGARGADSLGRWYATVNKLKVTTIRADWEKYGRAAGPKRNGQMAEIADALIAFWDGKSSGTADMIRQARQKGLSIHIVYFNLVEKSSL